MANHSSTRVVLALIALCVLHLALVWPALHSGFALDDYTWLESARRGTEGSQNWMTFRVAGFLRPVANVSWSVCYALAGTEPFLFNTVNVFLDVGCSILLFFTLIRLRLRLSACLIGAVAFASHPTHTEVVSWASARVNSLALVCFLISLHLSATWAAHRKASWQLLSLLFFSLALLAKEEAVLLLPALFLGSKLMTGGRVLPLSRQDLCGWVGHGIVLAIYLAWQVSVHSQESIAQTDYFRTNPVAVAFDAVLRIPRLFVNKGIASYESAWVALLVLALPWSVMWKKVSVDQHRILGFGGVMAFLALLPTSLLTFNATEKRYLYLATAFSSIVLAVLTHEATRANGRWVRVLLLITVAVCVVPQPYRLHRGLRYWNYSTLDLQLRESARRLTSELKLAEHAGEEVVVAIDVLNSVHARSLFYVITGIDVIVVDELPAASPDGRVLVAWTGVTFRIQR